MLREPVDVPPGFIADRLDHDFRARIGLCFEDALDATNQELEAVALASVIRDGVIGPNRRACLVDDCKRQNFASIAFQKNAFIAFCNTLGREQVL
jgi:hypothetical protein